MMLKFSVFCSLLILLSASLANATYVIDGDVDDWGIDLSASGAANTGYLNSHLPSGGLDIDYVTEDNADATDAWQSVIPGWTHDNSFDAEAMYFDNDDNYAYLAIIQGMPFGGATAPGNPWFYPGDIAIKIGGGTLYNYGIDVSSFASNKADFYENPNWDSVAYSWIPSSNPWRINSGTVKGQVSFVYSGEQNTHYVLEAAIPLSYLGLNANSLTSLDVHWTQQCGNDVLNLHADVNPVPEPGTLLMLGAGLMGLMGYGRLKLKRRKIMN